MSGGKWGPVSSATALTSGTYTAVAEEASSLGNAAGHSATVTFVINTEPPEVGLNAVKTPSNNTKPSFSGTASESLQVTVKIYKGSKPEGTLAATAEASVASGKWGPVSSSPETQKRDLHGGGGRRPARSATPPAKANWRDVRGQYRTAGSHAGADQISLQGHQTDLPRNGERKAGTVTVHVYPGKEAKGTRNREIHGDGRLPPANGTWWPPRGRSRTGLTRRSPPSRARSAIPGARAKRGTFEVDTEPPEVTLNPVTTPSDNANPLSAVRPANRCR